MNDEAPFRIGLRVEDVSAAAAFYEGLGFERTGTLSSPDGRIIMAILRRGDLQLLVDALTGMPFPGSERERGTLAGPRGLGVVIGVAMDDVEAAVDYCRSAVCEIATDPVDAPWGERYAEVVDPYGYAWKFFQVLPDPPHDSLGSAYDSWFG
ncbi:VOC family protein [Microbispora sp. NBC_01189]|uniref:VOC family protein n=1 Tax=Microbispora sp. NBC_01189 TaxID=2903583 RepID=UPI002E13CB6A|nr:VOC family protein [Microbispora sp. NBC_01189]